MSNTILNWRFGTYHLQVIRFGDWRDWLKRGKSPITWRRNAYQIERRANDPEWKCVEFYETPAPLVIAAGIALGTTIGFAIAQLILAI